MGIAASTGRIGVFCLCGLIIVKADSFTVASRMMDGNALVRRGIHPVPSVKVQIVAQWNEVVYLYEGEVWFSFDLALIVDIAVAGPQYGPG
jgi:TRAP-type mannitol/chloroaromatic compound transport system permease large subunit